MTLPEPWVVYCSRGVLFAPSAYVVTIYRRRHWWFLKRVSQAAGWTEAEAWNLAIRKLPERDLAGIIRSAATGETK